jgi:hypothetical protein
MASAPDRHRHRDFNQILDELGRADEPPSARFVNPAAAAAFPLGEEIASVASLSWASEADWLGEPEEAPIVATDVPPSDRPETIAEELGLSQARTEKDLHRARRRFMWRHHPDRNHGLSRDSADRRVAIANMLIDEALEKLIREKPPRR